MRLSLMIGISPDRFYWEHFAGLQPWGLFRAQETPSLAPATVSVQVYVSALCQREV